MAALDITSVRSWLGMSAPYDTNDTFCLGVIIAATTRMFADFLGYGFIQATWTEYYPPRVNLVQRDMLVDAYERSGTNKVVPVDRYRNERRVIMLRHLPVRSITSVYENPDAWLSDPPSFPAANLLTAGSDYSLDMDESGISKTGFLIRNTGPWTAGERAVKVTYTGGYSDSELSADYAVLQHAFLTQCQVAFNTLKIHRIEGQLGSMPGILASESLGDWSASYDTVTSAKLYGLTNKMAPAVAKMLEPYVNYSSYVF